MLLLRWEYLKVVLEELENKHLHPPQPCQEDQLDHENLQDPKEMEMHCEVKTVHKPPSKDFFFHTGRKCSHRLTRFSRLTSRSLETLRALR